MASIIEIEGVGDVFGKKLQDVGIRTTEALLREGSNPEGRRKIEEMTGISHAQVLRWVNHADLFRIRGVATQYSELLEAAGVDTVPELAQRNPDNLYEKLLAVDLGESYVISPPSADDVLDWVAQAKDLERKVSY